MTLGAVLAGAVMAHVTLSASPTHVALAPGGRQVVHLTAVAPGALQVRATVAGLALDLAGRPRLGAPTPAARRLWVTPAVVSVGRRGADVVLAARRGPGSGPGDHSAALVLTAEPPSRGVRARLRIGLAVTLRIPGPIVHRIELSRVHPRRSARARWLDILIANRGNVVEEPQIRMTLAQGERVVARVRRWRRTILPHSVALYRLTYRARLHGPAVLVVALPRPARPALLRTLRLRL